MVPFGNRSFLRFFMIAFYKIMFCFFYNLDHWSKHLRWKYNYYFTSPHSCSFGGYVCCHSNKNPSSENGRLDILLHRRQTKHKSMQWTKQGSVVLWCVQPVQLTIITTLTLPPPVVAVECGSERENKQVVTWRKSRCSRARFQFEMVTIVWQTHRF